MTPRMLNHNSVADFPYLSVLATGGHTEIILTRGVGLHTIMGMTIDLAIGNYLDSVATNVLLRNDILQDKAQISAFITKYNKNNVQNQIPLDYFDGVESWAPTGKTLEKLAKYGDGSEVDMPIPVKMNQLATMSFSGLGSHVKFKIFDKQKGGKLVQDSY